MIFVADHLREVHVRHRGLERATSGMTATETAAYLERIGPSANIPPGCERAKALRRAKGSRP